VAIYCWRHLGKDETIIFSDTGSKFADSAGDADSQFHVANISKNFLKKPQNGACGTIKCLWEDDLRKKFEVKNLLTLFF